MGAMGESALLACRWWIVVNNTSVRTQRWYSTVSSMIMMMLTLYYYYTQKPFRSDEKTFGPAENFIKVWSTVLG